jgi:hypothetical protein
MRTTKFNFESSKHRGSFRWHPFKDHIPKWVLYQSFCELGLRLVRSCSTAEGAMVLCQKDVKNMSLRFSVKLCCL